MSRSFLLFAIGGLVGFGVDVAVFYGLLLLSKNPYLVRIGSFTVAATSTWLFNRRMAFNVTTPLSFGRSMIVEWGGYVGSQVIGFLVNYGVFVC